MVAPELAVLLRQMVAEGFDPATYSLSTAVPGYSGYQLVRLDRAWKIRYYERGDVDEIASFDSKEEAVREFLDRMRRDFPPSKAN